MRINGFRPFAAPPGAAGKFGVFLCPYTHFPFVFERSGSVRRPAEWFWRLPPQLVLAEPRGGIQGGEIRLQKSRGETPPLPPLQGGAVKHWFVFFSECVV